MSEYKNQSSSIDRIAANLNILCARNPDLNRLLVSADVWLDGFVQQIIQAVATGSVSRDEFAATAGDFLKFKKSKGPDLTNASLSGVSSSSGAASSSNFAARAEAAQNTILNVSQNATLNTVQNTVQSAAQNAAPNALQSVSPNTSQFALQNAVQNAPQNISPNTSQNVSYRPVAESLTSDISPNEVETTTQASAVGSLGNGISFKPEDIDQLEKRLLLKIEASRWALERDRLLKTTADFQKDIEPHDHALLARARELTNCYLWMNNPETAPVIATDTYELLADAYAAAAMCVGFLRMLVDLVDRTPKSDILCRVLRDALYITATAQSALRRVTYEVSGREDQDQIRIHRWLTLLTKRYSIYVNRHMKKDSLAPVERIYVIPEYIERLKLEVAKLGQKQKILMEGFRRIQYHASRILSNPESTNDWQRVIETVDELVDAGTSANDPRFSETLPPILSLLKEVPSYKEHPFFINVLMELEFWHKNTPERELIERELNEMPPKPSISPDSDVVSEYSSIWDEMERGDASSESAKTSTLRAPLPSAAVNVRSAKEDAVYTTEGTVLDPQGADYAQIIPTGTPSGGISWKGSMLKKDASGFGAGILFHSNSSNNNDSDSRTNDDSRRVSSPAANSGKEHTFFSPIDSRGGIPSYASVVSQAHANSRHFSISDITIENTVGVAEETPEGTSTQSAEGDEKMMLQAQNAVKGKTVVLIDDESSSDIKNQLAAALKTNVVAANEPQVSSMLRLTQVAHPENVVLVILVEGTIPATNRNLETYCRNFDKPLLRVRPDVKLISIVRQIVAALTLWH